MFEIAILIGIYSCLISLLGFLGLLYKQLIIFFTLVYLLIITLTFRKRIKNNLVLFLRIIKKIPFLVSKNKTAGIFLTLIILGILINLIGALGPELSFDALWYHLVLPEIYLSNHRITHIGGLLYYSDMPKLTEMVYVFALVFNNEVLAKLIHFSFGILVLVSLYKLSRKLLSINYALLAILIFCSNLVFSWQSTTAYVDLARTFFEFLALWAIINWRKEKKKKWLIESAVMLGLAITVKLLSLVSLIIFLTIIVVISINEKKSFKKIITNLFLFCFFALIVPLPWFVFSFLNTGSPVFPFFSPIYKINLEPIGLYQFINSFWGLFVWSADPISPLYLILLPLVAICFKKLNQDFKLIAVYSFLALLIWYFTPRTGGGRFILPYLPAFSILIAGVLALSIKDKLLVNFCIFLVIGTSLLSIFYRGVANAKYLPVIFRQETKDEFLTRNLNFNFGDFYDTDDYFKNNISSKDKVLLYGFHNLYYLDFPFIDSSWVKKGNKFNYIATQNTNLPKRFNDWKLIYKNDKTKVKLYYLGGQEWVY